MKDHNHVKHTNRSTYEHLYYMIPYRDEAWRKCWENTWITAKHL